jgi:hypothetical protein
VGIESEWISLMWQDCNSRNLGEFGRLLPHLYPDYVVSVNEVELQVSQVAAFLKVELERNGVRLSPLLGVIETTEVVDGRNLNLINVLVQLPLGYLRGEKEYIETLLPEERNKLKLLQRELELGTTKLKSLLAVELLSDSGLVELSYAECKRHPVGFFDEAVKCILHVGPPMIRLFNEC